jgi:hypothetical protein
MARHNRHSRNDRSPGPVRALRQFVSILVAITALMLAAPGITPAAAQETAGTGAIEVHVSQCPPGHDGSGLYDDCHANGLAGVDVSIAGATSDTKTTEGGIGAVRFAEIPTGSYAITVGLPDAGSTVFTYCSIEGADTEIPITPENSNGGSVEVAEGQAVICDFYVVPPADPAQPTQAPTDTPAEPETLASVTVDPLACPEGTDPDAGFDALAAACTAPVDNVTFTWGDAGGTLETINTSDTDPTNGENGQVLIDEIAPGSYTLYSDVPLDAAAERLFCVADGGNRYEKDFDTTGVTAFNDIHAEQIACNWFIVPDDAQGDPTDDPVVTPTATPAATATQPAGDSEDQRGVESGGSLVVHLALCPVGYDGDELYDTCHGDGIADQEFVLSGPDGDVSATTTVPQTPGPGIVEFTSLPAGDYTLAGGPPGDFGKVRLYCTTQPYGERIDAQIDSTVASFAIGEGQDILCDWYYIPENAQGETPTPTVTPEPTRAEILVTLLACPAGETMAGATYADFNDTCTDARDGVSFSLGDQGAPPLTAKTGASGSGAVRFYDLLPGDYTLTPSLPAELGSAAIFCRIGDGDAYQKTITNGSTTFVDVDGESITCDWFVTQQKSQPQPPEGPTGAVTVREFLCEGDKSKIKDWEQECKAGSSGVVFTLASVNGAIDLSTATDANGVATFTALPDGFYSLKQSEGMWCKAKAERVDSQSRVIVEGGQNTDVFIYQCAQVTDLPSTGTGPGIGPIGEDAWWSAISGTQAALMGIGALGAMLLAGWGISRRLRI